MTVKTITKLKKEFQKHSREKNRLIEAADELAYKTFKKLTHRYGVNGPCGSFEESRNEGHRYSLNVTSPDRENAAKLAADLNALRNPFLRASECRPNDPKDKNVVLQVDYSKGKDKLWVHMGLAEILDAVLTAAPKKTAKPAA